MRPYKAFLKKELMEFTRTYKLLIIFAVFLLFAMMNPLTAKFTPLLMENLMPEGLVLNIADPTALDSWTQFYKNMSQIGLIILVILFSGLVSNELSKDTLVNVLTKGLSRKTVILSKFTMAVTVWTASYLMYFIVSWGYTQYFWSQDALHHIIYSAVCLWIYGVLLIAATLLGGVLTSSSYGSLLFTGAFAGLMMLISIIPKAERFNPLSLSTRNLEILTGSVEPSVLFIPIAVSVGLTVVFIIISIIRFNKKKL